MARRFDHYQSDEPVDFFISYTPADEAWAMWIAWELERAGYRAMLQAWDFVPGTNFVEFMDRGLRLSKAVIAVLSENYLHSRYGRHEWQAAWPTGKLMTVRIEEFTLTGLLSAITFVDLAPITDPDVARTLLLSRIREALDGRAKPPASPHYPSLPNHGPPEATAPPVTDGHPTRREGAKQPPYPPADLGRRSITVLHIAGPRFEKAHIGSGIGRAYAADIAAAITRHGQDFVPNIVAISGNLTDTGSMREFDEALAFVDTLAEDLRIPVRRFVMVPGPHDLTRAASVAYFANCEADDTTPTPPYFPKWRHYTSFFQDFYADVSAACFVAGQPWSLFTMPEMNIAVAAMNSTVADSHRTDDRYGWLGDEQADWLSGEMVEYLGDSWLRIGVVGHPLDQVRDADRLLNGLAPVLDLMICGTGDDETPPGPALPTSVPTVVASRPGEATLITVEIHPDGRSTTILDVDQLTVGEPGG